MDLHTIFKRLGYPKHTEKIYEVLLASAAPLYVAVLAREAGVSRVVVYRCLALLLRDKLVMEKNEGGRTTYVLGSADALTRTVQLTETSMQRTAVDAVRLREKDVPANIRFLYGAAGMREAFDDVVLHTPRGGTVYRYTSEKDVHHVNAYLAPDYRQRRDAKKLERLVISNPVSSAQKRKRLERFIRCIPSDADAFNQDIIQLVYGDRVSFIDIAHEQVTLIEHRAFASFQKVIFKQLYKKLDRE
jgi:DNA-binding transcriptional regulator GbsR (MarR family)